MTNRPALFVRAGGAMINTEKLLYIKHYAKIDEGVFRQDEHYKATFEGAKEPLWLQPDEGKALLNYLGVDCYQ